MSGQANWFVVFIYLSPASAASSTSLSLSLSCCCLHGWNFPISWQSIKITTLHSGVKKLAKLWPKNNKICIRNLTNITHTPRSANALCALFTQLSKKLCQLVCAQGVGGGDRDIEWEGGNGNGKWQNVKLYLDHDFCRLENLPLASSSLWAQLL